MINDPSLQAVVDALTMYQNDLDTLQAVVKAADAYLGDEWLSLLPSVLDKAELETSQKDLLKERADHAIHYYGATAAYSEIQEYLKDPQTLDKEKVMARLPVLEYWMEFFGDEGMDLVRTLKTKLEPEEAEASPQWDAQVEKLQQEVKDEPAPVAEEQADDESKLFDHSEGTPADAVAQAFANILRPDEAKEPAEKIDEDLEIKSEPEAEEAEPVVDVSEETAAEEPVSDVVEEAVVKEAQAAAETDVAESTEEPVVEQVEEDAEVQAEPAVEAEDVLGQDKNFPSTLEEAEAQTQSTPVQRENVKKDWDVENFLREWHLYEDVFAWLNARAVRLKLTDKRNYPYYGFLVDLMRTLHDDAQALLDNAKFEAILPVEVEGGREAVEGLVAALDKEILDLADEYPVSVEEQLNPKKVEDILGPLDTGPEEDVGPDPNDFEEIEDPYEAAKKEEAAQETSEKTPAEEKPEEPAPAAEEKQE